MGNNAGGTGRSGFVQPLSFDGYEWDTGPDIF
jgi:hypothetical protein